MGRKSGAVYTRNRIDINDYYLHSDIKLPLHTYDGMFNEENGEYSKSKST